MAASEREHTSSLVLAAGLSWRWISQENGIGVRGLPTTFGQVDFQIKASNPHEIWFEIGNRFSIPPGGLSVAPPLPPGSIICEALSTDRHSLPILSDGNAVTIVKIPCEITLKLRKIQ